MSELFLDFFVIDDSDIVIRPSPSEREWMDATSDRFAYRCLPLTIANAHSWEIANPALFSATWDGGPEVEAIQIEYGDPRRQPALSHFGHGILTFSLPVLIRTPPGYDLWVAGPTNRPKADIQPLTGIVETDWTSATFTMNWRFTKPGATVFFEKDEPICAFFPIRRGMIEEFQPRRCAIEEDEELIRAHRAWAAARRSFNADLHSPESEAAGKKWQRDYHRGPAEKIEPAHRTKVALKKTIS
ncbi:DUF6065 family protein [Afifella sp. IM 167]|uniref:DUF6065 family protein n=1 Tax=Afifella sp. IM 167 TaxID=2033586 RepID=UPI001CCD49FA|nr:DUF6065 family protein [Afifella sp. IM 167]MBZ8134840.1 hypothetical protein [Afifella sp. IM 167]